MAHWTAHVFFFCVRPNLFAKPSIILFLLPGVAGTGTGGISSSASKSIRSVSSLFLLFLLFLLLLLRIVPTVTFDRVLSSDLRGRQNPLSSVAKLCSDDDDDHRDSSRLGLLRGVPIAMILRLFMTLSRARSTPLSVPPDLNARGEAEDEALWMMLDRRRRDGVLLGERFGGERWVGEDLSGEGWNGPRMISGPSSSVGERDRCRC